MYFSKILLTQVRPPFKYELMITPALVEELETWLTDPYFLHSSRKFKEIHEKDIKLFYGFNLKIFLQI